MIESERHIPQLPRHWHLHHLLLLLARHFRVRSVRVPVRPMIHSSQTRVAVKQPCSGRVVSLVDRGRKVGLTRYCNAVLNTTNERTNKQEQKSDVARGGMASRWKGRKQRQTPHPSRGCDDRNPIRLFSKRPRLTKSGTTSHQARPPPGAPVSPRPRESKESTDNAGFVGKPVPGEPCSGPPTGLGPAHDKDIVGSAWGPDIPLCSTPGLIDPPVGGNVDTGSRQGSDRQDTSIPHSHVPRSYFGSNIW